MATAFIIFLVICMIVGARAGHDDSRKRAQKKAEEAEIRALILEQSRRNKR